MYIPPNPATLPNPSVAVRKFVSADGGMTWLTADKPPGPLIVRGAKARVRYVVTNTGNTPLTDIIVRDSRLGIVGTLGSLAAGARYEFMK